MHDMGSLFEHARAVTCANDTVLFLSLYGDIYDDI